MTPASLLLNNKLFSYEQLRSGKYESSTPFEEHTLLFCKQWLNGQEVFEQKTSGSTGKPKTIKITRAQMQLSARLTVEALSLKTNDVALVCIDTAFIGGKMMLVRGFEHKLQLIIKEPSSNPLEPIKDPIDFIAMVPIQFENSLLNHQKKVVSCKAIIIGGAAINHSLAEKIAQLKTPIYSTYGMTETVSHVALKRLSNPIDHYFTTLGDVKIEINSQEQLMINGAITNHQNLITNDRVELISSTEFRWLGRNDNVVNSGGIKIQLEEVENQIERYFESKNIKNRFFLYGIPDDYLGTKLILCVETNNIIMPMDSINFLSMGINKLSRPKDIIYINQFIETKSGKINRTESYKNR
ncbi:MAG: AMP-binding protein [Cyclobacteriaceae bacterium]|nr:AMP-binding protein [Cyclobacteriaceae bacterium]